MSLLFIPLLAALNFFRCSIHGLTFLAILIIGVIVSMSKGEKIYFKPI